MRTIKLISAVLLVTMLTLTTSCSKDEFNPSPFAVTTWEGDLNGINAKMYFYEYDCTLILTHNSTQAWTSGEYSFKDSKNTITFTPKDSGDAVLIGVVKDNLMTLSNEYSGKVIAKMYKK